MGNGLVLTTLGKQIAWHRLWTPSPTYTAPTVFKVGTGTTTPAIANTDLVTPVVISGGATFKTFVSGYPSIDLTTLQVTTRCLLLTTDANGNSLTEFGLFNTDATKKCFSRAVFTPVTKTAAVQCIFVQKDRMVL